MNYIDPEDFEWSDQNRSNDEKCVVINSFFGSINDVQNSQFANDQILKKEMIESIDSIHSAQEKFYTPLGESKLKFSCITSLEESQSLTKNYSGDAVNCLYRSEAQTIDLDNHMKQETNENQMSFEEEVFCNNKSRAIISNNSEDLKVDYLNENNPLNAETISLIRNSISGVYDPPESYSSINYISNEHEQIVPINNITSDENENPQESFNFPNQHEKIFSDKNTLENIESSISSSLTKEGANPISSTNEVSCDGELLGIQSLFSEEISFTPGGQWYKISKRSDLCSKTKVVTKENQLDVAAILNNSKKIRQIQGGIFIPRTLDCDKEEDFNNWIREEKFKIKSLFENFNVKLNIKYLTAERELIKLDRYLKQYSISALLDPMEILEFIGKTDVHLTNLLFTHQVYETVSKISKNCKGHLRVKSRTVLMKLKSLLLPPKGIKFEKYLNDLLIKNNVCKLKPEAPIEWMIHLLTFP
ncbi:uncharacterized protein [Halyomorpha halys]|uniref:uncharacterized protein n=1 Tax=Halyomorpha halys TaxID=286706 RepID=UPI0006D4D9B4|nr:uncharacterized protein LOC106687407 [Halyomorpha halys]